MSKHNYRSSLGCLVAVLVITVLLVGCGNKEIGQALTAPSPSLLLLTTDQPTVQPASTLFVPAPLFDADLDPRAGPVEVPLELQIPALKVNAPVLGVGLNSINEMDAPRGEIGDPIWHTAFWYRGSGIPGEPGTATFAGHVNDPLGNPEIFGYLQHLRPGDLIIVHDENANKDIRFIVDLVKVLSTKETSDPAVRRKIFGAGPLPAATELSHLTLITCAGNIVGGDYDHHTVVYATRGN